MPKVKLFKTHDTIIDYDYETGKILTGGVTDDWEDITDEELKLLKNNLWRMFPNGRENIVIVEQMEPSVAQSITTIVGLLAEDQRKRDIEAAEKEKKRVERMLKKKSKDEQAELDLLKHLTTKYPDVVSKK